jgi:hypothetical protein
MLVHVYFWLAYLNLGSCAVSAIIGDRKQAVLNLLFSAACFVGALLK